MSVEKRVLTRSRVTVLWARSKYLLKMPQQLCSWVACCAAKYKDFDVNICEIKEKEITIVTKAEIRKNSA